MPANLPSGWWWSEFRILGMINKSNSITTENLYIIKIFPAPGSSLLILNDTILLSNCGQPLTVSYNELYLFWGKKK